MFLILLIQVFVWSAIWALVRWRRVKRFWRERNVPHDPPHPILGSLTFLLNENITFWLRRIYKNFKAPYVGIWLFWRPGLIINSPELAKNILVKDADIFRNRLSSSGKSDPVGSLNLYTVNDPVWSSIRRRLTLVFTTAKLRALYPIINQKSSNVIDRITTDLNNKNLIDLRPLFTDYTTDVLGEAAFGVSSNATLNKKSALREVTNEFMRFSVFRGIAWASIFFLPELTDYFGFQVFPKKPVTYLRTVFRAMVNKRGGYDNNNYNNENKDLLDALLKMKRDAARDGENISEDLLLAQAAIFLQGGFDTTAMTLTFAVYEMAYQPEIQTRLYNEVWEAKKKIGDAEFDGALLKDLTYLNCFLQETLRKYPPVGWLDRVALKDYQLDEKLRISAGTVIYVNAAGMQYDPELFPEPEKFDPNRFQPDRDTIKPYTYMPFGEGPRHCIGKRFAFITMRYVLSKIILNFEIHPLPGSPKPNECHIENKGLMFALDQVSSVQFVPRVKDLDINSCAQ